MNIHERVFVLLDGKRCRGRYAVPLIAGGGDTGGGCGVATRGRSTLPGGGLPRSLSYTGSIAGSGGNGCRTRTGDGQIHRGAFNRRAVLIQHKCLEGDLVALVENSFKVEGLGLSFT